MPIRFRDIDALDHVNHAVILTYAETVRCDWFAEVAGVPSMAALPFILASAHVEYKAPIAKSDPIETAMWASRLGGKSWSFSYNVRHRATKAVFAEVETVQVAYDYKARASVAIPGPLRALLESLTAS
jgi:acyl-CoA thioester hydrolase